MTGETKKDVSQMNDQSNRPLAEVPLDSRLRFEPLTYCIRKKG